jgi:phospholipid-binding lipoprotein MlaA
VCCLTENEEAGPPSMSTGSTEIHGTTVSEMEPGGQGRVRGPARDKCPAGNWKGSTGQGRAVSIFQAIRCVLSPAHWISAGLLGAVLAFPVCAQDAWIPFSGEPADPIEQGKIDSANDPAEAINREIFSANKFFDDHVLKPVARAYGEDLSSELRRGIHNFTTNIGEPLVFANDVLQGNAGRALNTAQRFAVNTTIGVAGFVDVAGSWGRPYHYADLGQTLGVWGIAPGPAVQIPLLGPSNLRDAFGLAATSLAGTFALQGTIGSAVSYTELGATGVNEIDYRAKMLPNTDALEKNSKDLYASIRLIKAQLRAKLIEEGKAGLVSREGASSAGASRP